MMRVDPGERIVVEVVDYDEDRSNDIDTITVEVAVNDGESIQLASETGPTPGSSKLIPQIPRLKMC